MSENVRPDRRAELLLLGLELFGQESFESVSIDEIARRAGISRGLLYHYFGNKRGYYVETVRFAAERLLLALVPDFELPPLARVRQGLDAYLAFASDHAATYSALMHGGLGADRGVLEIVDQTRSVILGQMAAGYPSSGESDNLEPVRLSLRAWLGAVEAATLAWLPTRPLPREALHGLLLAQLAAMLRATWRNHPTLPPPADGGFLAEVLAHDLPTG